MGTEKIITTSAIEQLEDDLTELTTKLNSVITQYNLVQAEELNHHVEVEKGILERQCQALIQDFFNEKRLRKS